MSALSIQNLYKSDAEAHAVNFESTLIVIWNTWRDWRSREIMLVGIWLLSQTEIIDGMRDAIFEDCNDLIKLCRAAQQLGEK